jgi:hypothetical protein
MERCFIICTHLTPRCHCHTGGTRPTFAEGEPLRWDRLSQERKQFLKQTRTPTDRRLRWKAGGVGAVHHVGIERVWSTGSGAGTLPLYAVLPGSGCVESDSLDGAAAAERVELDLPTPRCGVARACRDFEITGCGWRDLQPLILT